AKPRDNGIGDAADLMSWVVDGKWRRREDPPKAPQRTGHRGPEVLVLILTERRKQLPHTGGKLLNARMLNEHPVALPSGREVVQLRDVREAGHAWRSKLTASTPAGTRRSLSKGLSALRSANAIDSSYAASSALGSERSMMTSCRAAGQR